MINIFLGCAERPCFRTNHFSCTRNLWIFDWKEERRSILHVWKRWT